MKSLKATITQEDIDNGTKGSYYSCPIALAIYREYPNCGDVFVTDSYVWTTANNNLYTVSKRAAKFVDEFDNGTDVKPSVFIFKQITDKNYVARIYEINYIEVPHA